ncbi:MAG: Gfo/Idh/MocA family oxidoreductase [Planctomycetes bacterium]|nr:Gfo/Idh/MocA family oxidoreductase [Planctomycetota bacterium]
MRAWVMLACLVLFSPVSAEEADAPPLIRVGIIGLDTSHAPAFARAFNDPRGEKDLEGFRVVAAYPKGSPDIPSSVSRVPQYTEEMKGMGVEIVDSIPALLEKVDAVLLETNDGRPHLEQAIPVIEAGKRLFIDKPVAGTLADAIAIYDLAARRGAVVFSASSLRYTAGAQEIRGGKIGKVLGADVYSPASLEKTHPDLFWYGIHGVEILFTVMGTGCETVTRVSSADTDVVAGRWKDGRIGTFRGIRAGKGGYGGTAFGAKAIEPIGDFPGYRPLVVEIAKLFRTGVLPVSPEETIEIYAFMEAADESKRRGGAPVSVEEVLAKAREGAKTRLAELGK